MALSAERGGYFESPKYPDRLTALRAFLLPCNKSKLESPYRCPDKAIPGAVVVVVVVVRWCARGGGDRVSPAINEARGDASLSLIVPESACRRSIF